MKPRQTAHTILSITRSKAKMYEYGVPEEHHIAVPRDPAKLFDLTIGILGDLVANDDEEATTTIEDNKNSLRFASYFFDAYLNSRLDESIDEYLLLLGSAAYFLCDLPGSSKVLIDRIDISNLDLDAQGLDKFVAWILRGDFDNTLAFEGSTYSFLIGSIQNILSEFRRSGDPNNLSLLSSSLKDLAYDNGSPRELLLADIAHTLIKKRIEISVWNCLPKYSELELPAWRETMQHIDIKEMWPAQRLLGENGVYKGTSAVVQMPTSAGKTKSTELIIRSAFLAERASLAVIVAPFRALCSEINDSLQKVFSNEDISVDRLSDSIQTDFEIQQLLGHKQIVVVTPEKLNYMLRYEPTLAQHIGLLIYDEGHLFDDSSRGVTYELLLASLKAQLSVDSQVVLISAVISNAEGIKSWLLDEEAKVVTGTNLTPTYRTIAFTSWRDKMLHFVAPDSPDNESFFVPRILSQETLGRKPRERSDRVFPENADGNDIALYLGLRLASKGTAAIFTGRKISASKLVKRAVEIYDRNTAIPSPREVSNPEEVNRLIHIYTQNFGDEELATEAAELGVYAHHGDTPQGIRLCIEHALQNNLIQFVICTSTLAQGVNLPLRYLIVANTRHSQESIKTRDFHNLIGRAGRSGMYTEGSIIFANPELWDEKNWRWREALRLLNPNNSEPCLSHIAILLKPLEDLRKNPALEIDALALVQFYMDDNRDKEAEINSIVETYSNAQFPAQDIKYQMYARFAVISNIESYLLANLENPTEEETEEDKIAELAKNTLAYSQLDDGQKETLIEIFQLIAQNLITAEASQEKRIIFSRTFQGIRECRELSVWVEEHVEDLQSCESDEDFIATLWPLFSKFIKSSAFQGLTSEDLLKQVCLSWLQGLPFHELFSLMEGQKIGTKWAKMEHVISICESGFSYDGALIVGAVSQLLELQEDEEIDGTIHALQEFQKKLKYGLPYTEAINMYELGFSDRCLAQELSINLHGTGLSKSELKNLITEMPEPFAEVLAPYPSYFHMRLNLLRV